MELDVLSGRKGDIMADKTPNVEIIRTKLHRPPLPSDFVPRTQLLEQLDQHRQRPLTLVSAPAGYGKSLLMSSWLEASDGPGAWVSLDEDDSDLRLFLTYVLAALHRMFPDALQHTQALVESPDLPPWPVFARSLINDLDQIEQPFLLALDDYHLIREHAVPELLADLLRHPPRSMHLVLATRRDPLLPLPALRALGQVTEIHLQDLRLSRRDIAAFLHKALEAPVDEATVVTLEEKTEGWVTGVRLAALYIRHLGDIDRMLADLRESTHYAREYLFTEILAHQPPDVRHYLLCTSILNRFCAPLCETICGGCLEPGQSDIGGWEFIARLNKDNMFVIPLDAEHRWFRFHHLFQKLLVNQLQRHYSAEDINALHARASAWFAENGLIEEAIRHALAAGDVNGAAQLVAQHRQALLNSDRWYVLEKWLSMLPDTVIQQRPELVLAQVWVDYFQFKYALIPASLDLVESLLHNEPQEQPLYGELYLFKGIFCFFQGHGALSLKHLEDALEQIPPTYHMIRGFTEIYFGVAGQMHGQHEQVVQVLSDLLHHQPLNELRKVRVMVALMCVHMISGNLTVASELNQQLRNFAIRINSALYTAWSLYFQGLIHFCRNELDMAIHHFSQATDLTYVILRRGGVGCLAGLTLAYQAMHQTDNAAATLERLVEYIHALHDPAFLDIAHSCRARVSLMKGEAPFTPGVPGIHTTSNGEPMLFWLEVPVITYCRGLLAEGSEAGLREVEKTLQECLRVNRSQHNTFQMIGIMVLQAVALQKQGRPDEALAVLEAAVDLARPGGWIRPFVESGPTVEGLLILLAEKNVAVEYLGQLLAAIREDQRGVKPGAFGTQTTSKSSVNNQQLVKPLTRRELEILDLLVQRLHNHEIADTLFISSETVKKHLFKIYRKLNVHGRQQAVAKARTLGLLSRH